MKLVKLIILFIIVVVAELALSKLGKASFATTLTPVVAELALSKLGKASFATTLTPVVAELALPKLGKASFATTIDKDIEVNNALELKEFSGALARDIGEAYQLTGLSDVVRGKMGDKLNQILQAKLKEFAADAFLDIVKNSKKHKTADGKVNVQAVVADAGTSQSTKAELKVKLQEKIKKWLPQAVSELVQKELLGGEFLDAAGLHEFREIEQKIVKNLNTTLNDKFDEIGEKFYGEAVGDLNSYINPCKQGQRDGLCGHVNLNIDVTDLKGTFNSAFNLKNVAGVMTYPLASAFGDSTVRGIQDRIETALNGQLPPEAMKYLKMGPDKFKEYADQAKKFLPGSQLKNVKNKLFGMPLLKLPNEAYGGILAGMSAMHFGKGLAGCPMSCNWHEINRGREVAQVLVWQMKNKKAVSLTLGNFLDLAKSIASKYGMNKLGGITKLKVDLLKVSDRINKIDKLLKQPLDKMQSVINKSVKEIQDELLKLQGELLDPLKNFKNGLAGQFAKAQEKFGASLGSFNGLPGDFGDLKKRLGIKDDLFGKMGDFNPLKEGKKWMKDNIAKITEKVFSGKKGKLGSQAVSALGVLGPKAEIKKSESVPKQNPSSNNAFDPVLLHSGEFYHRVSDLKIAGRGVSFEFARIYKSGGDFRGLLGFNWTHNYAERILAWDDAPHGKGVAWVDSGGKKYFFKEKPEGYEPIRSDTMTIFPKYESPKGVFEELYEVVTSAGEEFVLRSPDGVKTVFDGYGFMRSKSDRFGNELRFIYDDHARMTSVIDALGREIKYFYDETGKISHVTDLSGRTIRFAYDPNDDLIGATDQLGRTTRYRYQDHRLTMVTDKKGQTYLQNTYGTVGDNAGKVVEQVYGSDKFHIKAEYRGTFVWVTDKRGVTRVYDHNDAGGLLGEWVVQNGKSVPVVWHVYNDDNLRTQTNFASGRYILREFEKDRPLKEAVCFKDAGSCRNSSFSYEPVLGELIAFEDPAGRRTTLEYDGAGALTTVVLPDKTATKFENNIFGQRTAIIRADGTVDRYEFLSGQLRKIIKDANGLKASWAFGYDNVGNVTSVTEPGGRRKEFDVNALGQVVSERDGDDTKNFVYDENGNIIKITSIRHSRESGNPPHRSFQETEFSYDILDNVTLKREKVGEGKFVETKYEYDPNENLARVDLPEGNSVDYIYDDQNRLIQSGHIKFEYGSDDNIISVTNGVGAVTKYDYNGFGENVSVVDPLNFKRHIERDVLGRIVSVVAERAKPGFGKASFATTSTPVVAELALPKLGKASFATTPTPVVAELALPDFNEIKYDHDLNDRLVSVSRKLNDKWLKESVVRDQEGRVVTFIDAKGAHFKFEYDALGRKIKDIDPLGNVKKYAYDANGDLIHENVSGEPTAKYEYDGLNRPIALLQEVGRDKIITTKFEWNGNGKLSALVDDNKNRTEFFYDERDRLIKEKFADGKIAEYKYDNADNLIFMRDPNGNIVTNTFDARGNLLSRAAGGKIEQQFAYDPLSRLIYSKDHDQAQIWYSYDSLSRLVGENQNGRWIVRNYDDAGNETAVMYPSRSVYYKDYDAINRLANVNGVAEFKYAGADKLAGVTFDNGITLLQKHDQLSRVSERSYKTPSEKLGWKYSHDSRNNLISDGENKYEYDGADRLVRQSNICHSCEGRNLQRVSAGDPRRSLPPNVLVGGGDDRREDAKTETWQLDGAGNWIDRYQPNEMNEYKDFEYDNNGNLISDGKLKYKYDSLNRLIEVVGADGSSVASYAYDVHNRRVSKVLSVANSSTFFYDGWNLVEEYENTSPSRQYVYGQNIDEILTTRTPKDPNTFYFLTDRLGSVRALSDRSGKITERYDYDPYGNVTSGPEPEKFSFTAREMDAETGLIYFRNRYYSPKMGRFMTRDPLGFADGVNMYAYVGNRPLNAIDPLGLFALKYHETITNHALKNAGLQNVARAVVAGNLNVDYASVPALVGFKTEKVGWHFDNLNDPRQIASSWNDVRNRIDAINKGPDIVDATTAYDVAFRIGQVMHTAQDFYSHSNWVQYWNEKGKFGDQIPTYLNSKIPDDAGVFTGHYDDGTSKKCPKHHNNMALDDPSSKKNEHGEFYDAELTAFRESENILKMIDKNKISALQRYDLRQDFFRHDF